MFKFNFTQNEISREDSSESQEQKWLPAKEIYPISQSHEFENIRIFICGHHKLKHLAPEDGVKQLTDHALREELRQSEMLHSDLIPAKYEGGLKIWECTTDLLKYLLQENVDMKGKQVLDLGCGAGLLGIFGLLQGAKSVHFQDYNASVIHSLTISNVKLNTDVEACRFFAGDWRSFANLLTAENVKYDIILTSETIYNTENYEKLCILLEKLLKPDGICYLAAKTYYFGVGGGVRQFESKLQERGVQKSKVCWKCSEGLSFSIPSKCMTIHPEKLDTVHNQSNCVATGAFHKPLCQISRTSCVLLAGFLLGIQREILQISF